MDANKVAKEILGNAQMVELGSGLVLVKHDPYDKLLDEARRYMIDNLSILGSPSSQIH